MSKKIKDEQKKFLGETLNQYDKALNEGIDQLDKKNREQNHKISSLVNSFDNEFLEKDVEGNMTTLENSKDGMVIINEIQGNTEVNYCKDGEKELILNGDIDTQGESFVTITEGVDGGLVDVSLEGNTEINLSKTKDPVLVTREFDDINCNAGKLQYTIDDVTTINDEPGKVDIDRIVGDTMVNHAVNGSEELILNAHINESGDNNITLNGVTSDGGKVDVALEGNTLVNVSKTKDDYITPTIEDKVDQGSVISLPEVSEGLIHIDEIEGNTLVNYCTDGAKELTLNGDIDIEGTFVTTTEGVDGGLVDVALEGNTLVNLVKSYSQWQNNTNPSGNMFNVYRRYSSNIGIQPNTTYTVIINNMSKYCTGYSIFQYTNSEGVTKTISYQLIDNKYFTINLTDISKPLTKLVIYQKYNDVEGNEVPDANDEFYILEGDWTNKEIPQYFEGMKSVGQDDVNGHKIEILSTTNNLLDLSLIDGLVEEDGKIVAKKAVMNCNTSLKLRPNTKYKVTMEKYDDNPSWIGFGYTANGVYTFIGNTGNQPNKVIEFTTPNEKDIIFYVGANSGGDIGHYLRLMKLEYANSSSNSTIAKHNKKEILLNEPLRSLPNGVKDRFVKIGGKWFIERKCGGCTFNGSETTWDKSRDNNDEVTSLYYINREDKLTRGAGLCDKFNLLPSYAPNQPEGIYFGIDINIRINKSRLSSDTIEGFVQWLQQNPVTVIYQLATPQYEPLEIEPTLNTYNDTTHLSNNSIIPCNMQIKNTGYNCILKPSTLYTIAMDTNKKGTEITVGINLAGAKVTTTNNIATITTPETLVDDSLRLHGKGLRGRNIRLLEGDKTNCIPSYFEGIKSSFEDKVQTDGSYKMEISSRNKNIFINKKYFQNDAVLIDTPDDNTVILKDTVPNAYREIFFIIRGLKANVNYVVTSDVNVIAGNPLIALQDINGTDGAFISKTETYNRATFKLKQGHDSIRLRLFANHLVENVIGHIEYRNIQIREETAPETYEASKSNSIQFSSIEPLRGVGNFHDRIVFKDGKLMIERNFIQVIVDGENLQNYCDFAYRTVFDFKCNALQNWYNSNFITDSKFKNSFIDYQWNHRDFESIAVNNIVDEKTCIDIIDKSIPFSVNSYKEILKEKPIKVVCQLSEPTYEEIPYDLQKIILESYTNGTLFIDTNIPPTKVSFNCFEEELTYLYPSTSYTIQFNSDRNTTADITLGGTELLAQSITRGVNRISITTPETLVNNKLIIDGVGASISNVVVTDTDREFKYFEGMKSVGECEELEVLSNNKNLFDMNDLLNYLSENNEYGSYEQNGDGYNISCNRASTDLYTNFKPNTRYTLKIKCSPLEGFSVTQFMFVYNDGTVQYSGISDTLSDKVIVSFPNKTIKSFKLTKASGFSKNYFEYIQLEEGSTATDYTPHQSNIQQLNHEPLRRLSDGVKDKYTIIDGKWHIERKCGSAIFDGSDDENWQIDNQYGDNGDTSDCVGLKIKIDDIINISGGFAVDYKNNGTKLKCNLFACKNTYGEKVNAVNYGWGKYIFIKFDRTMDKDKFMNYLKTNPLEVVYPLETSYYEEIDYNPLETYSDITHITTNSTIPTNITVKNHGYNMVALKENTQYTLYVNKDTTNALTYRLGDYIEINSLSKFTFTTPSTLTDKTLRIDGKGAKVKDLMLIEGTPTNDSIGYFDGLKSSYECERVADESDENYGKYKVETIVRGKNLFGGKLLDFNNYTLPGGAYKSCQIKLMQDIQYTINVTGSGSTGEYYLLSTRPNPNEVGAYWYSIIADGVPSVNKTITAEKQDYYICYWNINGVTQSNFNSLMSKITVQLEEGTEATEYEPYFESKQTVYLNSPLLKGDEIVWKDNKIQHYHKMKTIVFDGSDDENWSLASISTQKTNVNVFDCNVADSSIINDAKISAFSDKLPSYSASYLFNTVDIEGIGQPSRRIRICLSKSKASTIEGFKQWLQQNPIKVAYTLETPYYEEISDYPLKLNAIANSSLSTESTIQVTNISFNIYEETLPYLYPNTKYYITFNSDVDRNNIIINLGGSHVVLDCKVGFNKVEITTPSDTTNLLTFSGTGVNIDHVKVTQQDIDEYFEGMKSVGECEELEITSANSDNTLLNSQALTHEPLRAVGNTKDRYILIDNKWYIERNCGGSTVTINKNGVGGDLSYTFSYPHNGQSASSASNTDGKTLIVDNFYGARSLAVADYSSNGDRNTIYFHYTNMDVVPDYAQDILKFKDFIDGKTINLVFVLKTPIYEPINYNPFEVYSDTTHITTNSLIPSNVVVKNHGYNCLLKPSTKYTIALNKPNGTISAKLGGSAKVDSTNSIFTITTPSTLNDNVLRLSGSGNVKDIMILEGDKTVNTPSYFEGIESVFEQEYDTEKGKYRVTAKVIGKNLFDGELALGSLNNSTGETSKTDLSLRTVNFIPVISGSTITLSNDMDYHNYIYEYDGNYNFIKYTGHSSDRGAKTITLDNNTKFIKFRSISGNNENNLNVKYQLEQGDTATSYESYKESNVTFYIDEPLRSVKDIKDKIFIKDGKVIIERNCGHYIFNENTPWIGSDHVNRGHWIRVNDNNIPNYKPNLNPILSIPSISSPMGYPYWQNKDNEIEMFWDWSGTHMYIFLHSAKTKWDVKVDYGVDDISNYMKNNPIEMIYQLAEPVYEEADCDLSKLALENYENSSLIFESNIPVSANIRYSGEVPVVTQAKSLSSQVDNTTLDINENIIPYMCDIDYRIVELQLMNGDTQGEGIELLGIGDIEILGNENVLFNNREDKKYNYSYDMLKRDILSQRYSKEEYQYRLDRYLLANKISDEEYKELEGLLNNGE